MAKVLKNIFTTGSDAIIQNYIINSWHVSQSVDAFTGAAAYDILVSGSLGITGSFFANVATINSTGSYTALVKDNATNQILANSAFTSGTSGNS